MNACSGFCWSIQLQIVFPIPQIPPIPAIPPNTTCSLAVPQNAEVLKPLKFLTGLKAC